MQELNEIFSSLESEDVANTINEFLQSPEGQMLEKIPSEIQLQLISYFTKKGFIQHLQIIKNYSTIKEIKKAAGKALYNLSTKGIKIEDGEFKKSKIFKEEILESKEPFSVIFFPHSPFEFFYTLFIYEYYSQTPFSIFIKFDRYVFDKFHFYKNVSKKKFFEIIQDISKKFKLLFSEISPHWTKHRIQQGIEMLSKEKVGIPKNFMEIQYILQSLKSSCENPLTEMISLDEIRKLKNLQEKTPKLLEFKEFSGWRPPKEIFLKINEKINFLAAGPILLTKTQVMEYLINHIENTLVQFFTPKMRLYFSEILKDCAYIFLKNSYREKAELCLSCALGLEDFSIDIKNHPFAREFFMKFLSSKEPDETNKKSFDLIIPGKGKIDKDKKIIKPF